MNDEWYLQLSACGLQHCIEDNLDLYECIYICSCSYIFYDMYCKWCFHSSAKVSQIPCVCQDLHQLQPGTLRNGAKTWMLFRFSVRRAFLVLFGVCLKQSGTAPRVAKLGTKLNMPRWGN